MRLAVDLYGVRVGTLQGDARSFDFTPDPAAVERFGINSVVLSVAIPLAPRARRDRAGRRRNWFEELLPEGDQYDHMVARAALRRGDTPRFLARYGRDVAGAVEIWDVDDPTEPREPATSPVTDADVRTLLEDPMGSPLGNAPRNGRTSLGGVQPKIVLARTSGGWAQALGGHPSTHILKPRLHGELSSVIFDEEYGARLARTLGLASFQAGIAEFDGLPALVIERYDRTSDARIHQEDFNQALGARRNQKYQEIGGVATLRRVADVLRAHTSSADLRRLARAVVFAVAIGNLDMHTKNIALLHPADGDTALAPVYDAVPQAHRSDGRLALAVAGEYGHAAITRQHLVGELSSWGLRRAEVLVDDTLEALLAATERELPVDGAHPALHDDIRRFAADLLADAH